MHTTAANHGGHMSDPYLIAHKVRGLAAFDIAIQMICPLCPNKGHGCHECDGLGYWWIVPTSGHRAYPAESWKLYELLPSYIQWDANEVAVLPDHYPDRSTAPRVNLIEALGLRPAPAKIERRL
jgi:hypothetical protein